jgi:hypothetical protein
MMFIAKDDDSNKLARLVFKLRLERLGFDQRYLKLF